MVDVRGKLVTVATIDVGISLNRAQLCESVVSLHRQSILTMHMNDSQTADELPTKNISFVGKAAHRRNHKCSNYLWIAQNCAKV